MHTLSSLFVTNQFTQKIAPTVPPEVQQLVDQFGNQTGQLIDNFAYYGLLSAGLISAIALLSSSLLLILRYPLKKPVQPELRLIHSAPLDWQPKRPVESCIARTNRNELRMLSARIRAGQLSN